MASPYILMVSLLVLTLEVFPPLSYASIETSKTGAFTKAFDPTRATQVSWKPRAFVYTGFLSGKECDHLINLAKGKLVKSMVANDETGESMDSKKRTSSGMILFETEDEIVSDVEARIAAWTFLPEENGEPIQILRYEHGQKYEAHIDYFMDKVNQEVGGHRVATVLMYLSDVNKGGETVFPASEAKGSQPKDDRKSWAYMHWLLAVKPNKGDALLFFSLHPDATPDPDSLHASCPVIEGEKWSATKWIHVRSFREPVKHSKMGDCADENDSCPFWAMAGECEKNPIYMILRYEHGQKYEAHIDYFVDNVKQEVGGHRVATALM
uniref:procollagen-proline 4-dioxygenase n=1 Tax=Salix viminalis TaxID=40686 RepID=A0A6N2M4N5_SALVM